MEAPRSPAPGLGCGRLQLRAAGRDPAAAPVPVPAPPQGPAGGGGFAGSEFARPQEPEPRTADLGAARLWAGPPTRSVHIPVPAQRASPGKSRLDEVIAAAALTSLSSSRLLLGAPTAACSPEPGLEPWREGFVRPPGSCSWSWDLASEQSSPSTPSPPLPPEAAHFLFGEPARRKRKSSVQALFQCLWKQCGKVLSTASGMQRHVRLVHLGRQEEPEQSDGEEDFYYTELDAGVDTLTDGRSSLTPVSPVASRPPAFPHLGLPEAPALLPPPVVGSAVPPKDCMGPVHPEPQLSTFRACTPALPSKLGASPRKPQGDARKCRKVYGTDHRDLWCTACRWKKACRRLPD